MKWKFIHQLNSYRAQKNLGNTYIQLELNYRDAQIARYESEVTRLKTYQSLS